MTTVQSVERAVALLQEVARAPGGLVDLAARVGLATSTAARLLATLESVDALRRDDAGLYRIGPTVSSMADTVDPGHNLQTISDRHLVELAAELDEAMCLCILVGRDTAGDYARASVLTNERTDLAGADSGTFPLGRDHS